MDPSHARRFGDLRFDDDFLWAVRDDGERIRFTRLERSLLRTFSASPQRLFSRDQLLSAMSSEPEELSDRNVDFVISRLRRKLHDSARVPRFIATQYGEGYVWIAQGLRASGGGLVVIGPVRGVPPGEAAARVERATARLQTELAARCEVAGDIPVAPDWLHGQAGGGFRYSIGVHVLAEGARLAAAFTVRDEQEGRLIGVARCDLGEERLETRLRRAAIVLVGAIWRDLTLPPGAEMDPAGPPLVVRMRSAALTLSRSPSEGWAYVAKRLEEARAEAPGDPELAIMWATYLWASGLLGGEVSPDPETHRALLEEIEALVSDALPAVRRQPILRLAAGELIFLSRPDRHATAEALAQETLAENTCFAAALSLLGDTQAYRGELAAAKFSYDEALAFAAAGSEFQRALLVRKSTVLLAEGDWAGARAVFRLGDAKVPAAPPLQLLLLPPDDRPLDGDAAKALAGVSRAAARRLLAYLAFVAARCFGDPQHARNIMAGPVRHLARRFGRSILDDLPLGAAGILSSFA